METIGLLKKGIVVTATILMIACGGGDGGAVGPVYNGLLTQAVVDKPNSKDFSNTAYTGSGASGAFAGVDTDNPNQSASLKGFAKSFRAFTKGFDVSKGITGAPTAAVENINDTIPGECGGEFSFNINYDSETGSFNGSLTFSDYNDCDGTTNGNVTYSGTINGGDVSSFEMTFNSLSFQGETESITMNGTGVFSQVSSTTDQIVLNVDYRDNNSNLTYRTENLVIKTTDYFTYSSETITGKVYHPDYGYVNVVTEAPVIVNYVDDFPSSGILVLSGQASEAIITFTSDNTYTIEVDEGGDGTIEETKNCTWQPDECVI